MLLSIALTCSLAQAQNLQNEQKLIDHLGQERYDQLSSVNSPSLKFMDNRQEYGFEILEMESDKLKDMVQINSFNFSNSDKSTFEMTPTELLEAAENGELNILKLRLDYHQSANSYYRIGNTNKVLVLKSVQSIAKK